MFGPPLDFTQASTWPWIDHSASGLLHATSLKQAPAYALFRLGFPTAPVLQYLNLATYSNSQAHSTKGTPSPNLIDQALTACRSTVSGSISLPSRGAFHLSLTVLSSIGSYLVFSLGRWSSQIQTGFLVSRPTQVQLGRQQIFAYRAFTFSGRPSQCRSANPLFSNSTTNCPTTPPTSLKTVWALPRSFATTKGISF